MSRKTISLALTIGLIASAAVAPSAGAKRKAKAVKTSLYLHGEAPLGDIDGVVWLAEDRVPQMSPEKPEGSVPKSWRLGTTGLNTNCTGLPIGFPTWVGKVNGTIVGKPKLTAHFVAPPTRVTARIWTDVPVFTCNEAYVEPASEVVADVPAGHSEVEIVFDKLRLKAGSQVMIELLAGGSGQQGRILYDSPDLASVLQFSCIPARGRSCTP
jgi:hypothetical protein